MRNLSKIFSPIIAFSLLLGMVFSPLQAQAGFLSAIFGDEAHAQQADAPAFLGSAPETALTPLISVNTFLEEKNAKKEGIADANSDTCIVSDTALCVSNTAGTGGALTCENGQYALYDVKSGDTVPLIAEMYDVTPDTILSANDHLKNGGKLKVGDSILIPPCPGVEYTVAKGDSLQGIYNKHKSSLTDSSFNDFLAYNEISADEKIQPGEKLFVPGAKIQKVTPKKSSSSSIARSTYSQSLVDASGYFAHPLPGTRRVRGIGSGHYGVDFGASTGTPIYAAASGVVKTARVGSKSRTSNGGYGSFVVIAHPNGTETLYAHMSKLGTSAGASVEKGEIIGYVGSTGRSTGPHLHFEVKGAKNPF